MSSSSPSTPPSEASASSSVRGLEPIERVAMRRLSVSSANMPLSLSHSPATSEADDNMLEENELDESPGELINAPAANAQRRRSISTALMKNQKMNEIVSQFKEGGDFVVKKLRGEESTGPTVEDPMLGFMNYDNHMDNINELHLEADDKHRLKLMALKFALTMAIALLTAATMYVVSSLASWCFNKRVSTTLALIAAGSPVAAYFQFIAVSMLFTAAASILVTFVAPNARGGGVPYALAYLNGTNVSSFFTFRIVAIKAAALGFTIAGGLTLGMEGPFVFLGGGIAILLSKTLDRLPAFSSHGKYTRILRNIKEERVFMAGGLAAGLAVAFSAPIAGILFALEGATAFLTVPVTLRIFGCSMFAMFFYDLARAGFSYNIKSHNLIEIITDSDSAEFAWMVPEILSFTILAVIGGLLGAMAVRINVSITKWRHHHMEGKLFKNIGEVALITFVTSTLWFVLPYIFGCRPQPDFCATSAAAGETRCVQAFCGAGEYSEIGSVVYSTTDVIIRNMFDRSVAVEFEFSPWPLLSYGLCYLLLVSWVYGAYVPGGLFVPSIVIGGVYGRIVGYVGRRYVASYISPGIYSLLGAAGMLGGFTRLALPVVVMLIEMTGDATYLLPIMYIATTAKLLADYLEPPLYPQHMQLEGIPTLGDVLKPAVARMTAAQLMNPAPVSLREVDRVGHVLDVLKTSKATLIPVTDNDGHFVGMIMRTSVIYALNYTPFHSSAQSAASEDRRSSRSLLDAENEFSNWADTTDYAATLHGFDEKLQDSLVNLGPFMDAGALTCREKTSAKRVAALFRRVGLSHVCVCDEQMKLLGVITRRSLIQGGVQRTSSIKVAVAQSPAQSPSPAPGPPMQINVLPPSPLQRPELPRMASNSAPAGIPRPSTTAPAAAQPSAKAEAAAAAVPANTPVPAPAPVKAAPVPAPAPVPTPAVVPVPAPVVSSSVSVPSVPSVPSTPSPVSIPVPSTSSPPLLPVNPPHQTSSVSGGLFSSPSPEELAARDAVRQRALAKKAAIEAKMKANANKP